MSMTKKRSRRAYEPGWWERKLVPLLFCVVTSRNGNLNAFFESSAHQKPTIFSARQKLLDRKFNQSLHVERSNHYHKQSLNSQPITDEHLDPICYGRRPYFAASSGTFLVTKKFPRSSCSSWPHSESTSAPRDRGSCFKAQTAFSVLSGWKQDVDSIG